MAKGQGDIGRAKEFKDENGRLRSPTKKELHERNQAWLREKYPKGIPEQYDPTKHKLGDT